MIATVRRILALWHPDRSRRVTQECAHMKLLNDHIDISAILGESHGPVEVRGSSTNI